MSLQGSDRWESTPRMLREPCEGRHGGESEEIFALDLPNGVRLWLCESCWVRIWRQYGCPEQKEASNG